MAVTVTMPQLGNTVESTILLRWHKAVGDAIAIGESLCEVETDKTTMEVQSTAAGTILKLLYREGDEIPVMVDIALIGEAGETLSENPFLNSVAVVHTSQNSSSVSVPSTDDTIPHPAPIQSFDRVRISPRARKLAQHKQVDIQGLVGTGPGGRIIERDVQTALLNTPKLTPLARAMVARGDFRVPHENNSAGRRITSKDLIPAREAATPLEQHAPLDEVENIPLKGARKVIAARMLASLQTTAQLTLSSSADARGLRAVRNRLKTMPIELGLRDVTINDLVLYAVCRVLPQFPDLNMLFHDQVMQRYTKIHLGMAVDTERGLLVPVIRDAGAKSLKALANEAHRLGAACLDGSIKPDELNGGTFTVSNLGNLGIETFTPVLNPPQVAILGVGTIQPKVIETLEGYDFVPSINLSLTVNHQVVDGAPAARFLQALARCLADLDLSIVTR